MKTDTGFVYHAKKFDFVDKRYPLGGASFCQVDAFFPVDWSQKIPCGIVVFTDPGGDSGVSVTNASEAIAEKFFRDHLAPLFAPELNPNMVLWVERYPRTVGREYETLDQVSYSFLGNELKFVNATWRSIRREQIEKAFGAHGLEAIS